MKKGIKEMMEEMKSSDMPKKSERNVAALKDVIMELLGEADNAIKGNAKSKLDEARAMKVAVMAKDKEGLMEGLEKAEDILEGEMPEMEDSEEEKEDSEEQEIKPEPLMEEKEEIKPELMEDEEESFFKKKKR